MNTVNMALDKLAADLRRKASLSRLFGTETGGAGQCLARHDPAGGGGSQPARRHSHADGSQPAPAETFDVTSFFPLFSPVARPVRRSSKRHL